jgi:hypothetical protein
MPRTVRYNIDKALNWGLHKTCLRWELVDRAEKDLDVRALQGTLEITVEGKDFVVTFEEK